VFLRFSLQVMSLRTDTQRPSLACSYAVILPAYLHHVTMCNHPVYTSFSCVQSVLHWDVNSSRTIYLYQSHPVQYRTSRNIYWSYI
jgi:hypothetical protein